MEKAGKRVIKQQTDKLKNKLLDKIFKKKGSGDSKEKRLDPVDLLKGLF